MEDQRGKAPDQRRPKIGRCRRTRRSTLSQLQALSALQAGSDILILRHPKTLEHIRKYLSNVMIETTLDAMGVDMSLAGEAPAAETKAAPAAAKPAPAKPAEQKVAAAAKPAPAPKVEKAPPMKEMPAAAAKPADEEEEADMGKLTKDEFNGDLKEMVSVFKALRTAFGGEARKQQRRPCGGGSTGQEERDWPCRLDAAYHRPCYSRRSEDSRSRRLFHSFPSLPHNGGLPHRQRRDLLQNLQHGPMSSSAAQG